MSSTDGAAGPSTVESRTPAGILLLHTGVAVVFVLVAWIDGNSWQVPPATVYVVYTAWLLVNSRVVIDGDGLHIGPPGGPLWRHVHWEEIDEITSAGFGPGRAQQECVAYVPAGRRWRRKITATATYRFAPSRLPEVLAVAARAGVAPHGSGIDWVVRRRHVRRIWIAGIMLLLVAAVVLELVT